MQIPRSNLILILVSIFSLTRCQTVSYKEPTEGSRARVRFVISTDRRVEIIRYDDADCTTGYEKMMALETWRSDDLGKKIGMPLWDYNRAQAKEVYVPANKPFYAIFWGEAKSNGTYIYKCGLPFAFTFAEGADYEVAYSVVDRRGCGLTVHKFESNADSLVTKVSQKLEKPKPDTCSNIFGKRK